MNTDNVIDILLSEQPLVTERCEAFVSSPDKGGLVLFVGKVRDHTGERSVQRLEFEAYEPMAINEMQKIAEEVGTRWPKARVAIHHRTGVLHIGDTAVIIAVATPHRAAAFAACAWAIDTLKQTVPIWKKEVFTDGEVWVAAHP